MKIYQMKKFSLTIVIFVMLAFSNKNFWNFILPMITRAKIHGNVKFVRKYIQNMNTWKDMLHQFMKVIRSYFLSHWDFQSNLTFKTLKAFLKYLTKFHLILSWQILIFTFFLIVIVSHKILLVLVVEVEKY